MFAYCLCYLFGLHTETVFLSEKFPKEKGGECDSCKIIAKLKDQNENMTTLSFTFRDHLTPC